MYVNPFFFGFGVGALAMLGVFIIVAVWFSRRGK